MALTPTRHLTRLLLALPSLRFGGTERHAAELAARLGAEGLEVTLAAEPALLAPLAAALPPGLPTPRIVAARLGWDEDESPATAMERQHAAAEALLATETPDIVLLPLPWPDAGLGVMRAAAARGLPRLVALHLAAEGPPPPAIAASLPALDAAGAAWAAVSAPVARRGASCFGLPAARIALIDNPAPAVHAAGRDAARAALRALLGLRADQRLILFVGRLEEAKGADLLPALTDRLNLPVAVLGDGLLRGHLEAEARADPRGLMRLIGQVADPTPWYLGADALVLPSRLEGAPLVFLEAAARFCPVVASAAALEGLGPDAPDLARIATSADAAGLAGAVQALLADPAGAAAMAARAAAEAARRTWQRAIPAWMGQLRLAATLAPPSQAARPWAEPFAYPENAA
ncbi:glycosyltransferase [Falsiroseomonas stagni]|uniref:Glycosyltransferase involved in cell wall bisynthesis n=1 Tax=Falsiroseomonas stagni DSM 19981 TaxID=1123062 RepID=A0A1I4BKC6_9PROT|nr:glycosyltransferase [Falsiroseomonas stagni]SFK68331.1 Glycosyltransferase involved in cell wall bisynthesis [Falsiroseomonas stagni DSM 19981]